MRVPRDVLRNKYTFFVTKAPKNLTLLGLVLTPQRELVHQKGLTSAKIYDTLRAVYRLVLTPQRELVHRPSSGLPNIVRRSVDAKKPA